MHKNNTQYFTILKDYVNIKNRDVIFWPFVRQIQVTNMKEAMLLSCDKRTTQWLFLFLHEVQLQENIFNKKMKEN